MSFTSLEGFHFQEDAVIIAALKEIHFSIYERQQIRNAGSLSPALPTSDYDFMEDHGEQIQAYQILIGGLITPFLGVGLGQHFTKDNYSTYESVAAVVVEAGYPSGALLSAAFQEDYPAAITQLQDMMGVLTRYRIDYTIAVDEAFISLSDFEPTYEAAWDGRFDSGFQVSGAKELKWRLVEVPLESAFFCSNATLVLLESSYVRPERWVGIAQPNETILLDVDVTFGELFSPIEFHIGEFFPPGDTDLFGSGSFQGTGSGTVELTYTPPPFRGPPFPSSYQMRLTIQNAPANNPFGSADGEAKVTYHDDPVPIGLRFNASSEFLYG